MQCRVPLSKNLRNPAETIMKIGVFDLRLSLHGLRLKLTPMGRWIRISVFSYSFALKSVTVGKA